MLYLLTLKNKFYHEKHEGNFLYYLFILNIIKYIKIHINAGFYNKSKIKAVYFQFYPIIRLFYCFKYKKKTLFTYIHHFNINFSKCSLLLECSEFNSGLIEFITCQILYQNMEIDLTQTELCTIFRCQLSRSCIIEFTLIIANIITDRNAFAWCQDL